MAEIESRMTDPRREGEGEERQAARHGEQGRQGVHQSKNDGHFHLAPLRDRTARNSRRPPPSHRRAPLIRRHHRRRRHLGSLTRGTPWLYRYSGGAAAFLALLKHNSYRMNRGFPQNYEIAT